MRLRSSRSVAADDKAVDKRQKTRRQKDADLEQVSKDPAETGEEITGTFVVDTKPADDGGIGDGGEEAEEVASGEEGDTSEKGDSVAESASDADLQGEGGADLQGEGGADLQGEGGADLQSEGEADLQSEGGEGGGVFVIDTKLTLQEEHEEVGSDDHDAAVEKGAKGDKRRKRKYDEGKERQLQQYLFGADFFGEGAGTEDEGASDEGPSKEEKQNEVEVTKEEAPKKKFKKKDRDAQQRQPVWKDEDDEDILVKDVTATYAKARGKHGLKETSTEKYSQTLKKKFTALMGAPKWAELGRKGVDSDDSDDEFFRETTDMMERGKMKQLAKEFIDYRKLKDLNNETHVEGSIITATEFHPRATVGLVAGINGTASLFQVDGYSNPKMHSVNFSDFPIKTAHFSADGSEFLCGSQKASHFFSFDLAKSQAVKINIGAGRGPSGLRLSQGSLGHFEVSPCGKYIALFGRFGVVHLLSARTKEPAFQVKMNDHSTAGAFTSDGRQMYTHGAGGEIYLWDIRQTRRALHKFVDDGCVRGTALAVSPDGRYLAAGADSGVVNLYEVSTALTSTQPKPAKVALNLRTLVSKLKFHPSSELLAMASSSKENAVKLMHVPSRTVFANFPSWSFNLKRVHTLDFSLNGGFFCLGNNRGAANLYRLKHFGNY